MKPVRITERDLIRERIQAAPSWLSQHERGGIPEVVARMKKIAALDPETATQDDLVSAGDSRQKVICDGCGKSVTDAVRVGEEPDYESRDAMLCRSCIVEAAEAMGLKVG